MFFDVVREGTRCFCLLVGMTVVKHEGNDGNANTTCLSLDREVVLAVIAWRTTVDNRKETKTPTTFTTILFVLCCCFVLCCRM